MPQVDTHHRLFPAARRLAKLAMVRWNLWKHRAEPAVQTWKPVLAGAYSGYIVVPSRAISSTGQDAAAYAAHRPGGGRLPTSRRTAWWPRVTGSWTWAPATAGRRSG